MKRSSDMNHFPLPPGKVVTVRVRTCCALPDLEQAIHDLLGRYTPDISFSVTVQNQMPEALNFINRAFDLTPKEAAIFKLVFYYCGDVVGRGEIVRQIFGVVVDEYSLRNINYHVSMLRKKLGEWAVLIQTVRGSGYRLNQAAFRQFCSCSPESFAVGTHPRLKPPSHPRERMASSNWRVVYRI